MYAYATNRQLERAPSALTRAVSTSRPAAHGRVNMEVAWIPTLALPSHKGKLCDIRRRPVNIGPRTFQISVPKRPEDATPRCTNLNHGCDFRRPCSMALEASLLAVPDYLE